MVFFAKSNESIVKIGINTFVLYYQNIVFFCIILLQTENFVTTYSLGKKLVKIPQFSSKCIDDTAPFTTFRDSRSDIGIFSAVFF